MLMAHPTVLRTLVQRYEALSALSQERRTDGTDGTEDADPALERQLQDTAYTLCVSTGTREVSAALATARAHIERGTVTTVNAVSTADADDSAADANTDDEDVAAEEDAA